MSSYLSSILTTTTSRYNSIRRTLLSDETDGDTEDDSHISRVLRAYYTEKGRSFPPWLPPDPKAPQSAPTPYVSASGRPGLSPLQPGGRGGGLSDLWDSPQQGPPQPESLSLRRNAQGRNPFNAAKPAQARPGGGGGIVDSYSSGGAALQPQAQRPLPSQRLGSYQSTSSNSKMQMSEGFQRPSSATSGSSAQERLKARLLGGGRATSPTPSSLAPPREDPYDIRIGPEDAGTARRRPQSSRSDAGRQAGPYLGATSPWSTGEDEYSGRGRAGAGGSQGYDYSGGDGGTYGRRGPR
ncbi:MAG: hypothetical protein M1837_003000 [Sclerophora amabilis]|nr:MAG: hypothetical protein M1837_003000 [Sclerophora amabilis]